MKHTTLPFLAATAATLVLAGAALAQNSAIHPKLRLFGGNSSNSIPFGWRPMHYQQILDWRAFSRHDTLRIKNLKFRMHRNFANGKYGGQRVFLSVHLALTKPGISPANSTGTFADNIDRTTERTMVVPRWVTLPKTKSLGFEFVIPFDSGKVFPYRAALRRNLSIQIRIFNNSNSNSSFLYPLDAHTGVVAGSVTQNGLFKGCVNNVTRRTPTHDAKRESLYTGSPDHEISGSCGRAGTPAILLIGTRPLGSVGIGLCELRNDGAILLTTVSSGTEGRVAWQIPIPNESRLRGAGFYTQLWWYQRGATPTGLFASRGLFQRISRQEPILDATRHWAAGPFSTKGTTTRGYGLVIGFDG